MQQLNWNDIKIIDYIGINNNDENCKNEEVTNNIPLGLSVSTMCASCKLNTVLNLSNIEKYGSLDPQNMLSIGENKTLIDDKNKRNKRIKKIKQKEASKNLKQKDTPPNHFYNQVTIVMRVDSGYIEDLNCAQKINLKLFKNGSVQMSGCKSLANINIVLNKLIIILKEIKAIFEDGVIIEKPFIEEPQNITIKDFKIDMINSNYQVNMQIDRAKLFNLLLKKKIKSTYEPCIRACVIIKYIPEKQNIEQKEISIFVFQKGNIIITGARSRSHIISAYNYMNDILLTHTNDIIKHDDKDEEDLILDIYKDIMKEVNVGLIQI
jgi:TATA-box binding protein (TBP) (component of TFIID and TFIIIB)